MERDSISSLYHNTMNRILLSSIFTFMLITGTIKAGEHTQYVNPFIGTGAVHGSLSGNNYPGATVPFGMIQLSPDTREAPTGHKHRDMITMTRPSMDSVTPASAEQERQT